MWFSLLREALQKMLVFPLLSFRYRIRTTSPSGRCSRGVTWGPYHRMSPAHLQRYVDEFAGRHNQRKLDTELQMTIMFPEHGGEVAPLP